MEPLHLQYNVKSDDFTSAGEVSSEIKQMLRRLGLNPDIVRRCSICMYEGEINMVIHASGGVAEVFIGDKDITLVLRDKGPGIPDLEQAMQEGFSTASQGVRELGFGAGMGLPNMKRYSDEMQIDTEIGKGTTVTMRIYLNHAGSK